MEWRGQLCEACGGGLNWHPCQHVERLGFCVDVGMEAAMLATADAGWRTGNHCVSWANSGWAYLSLHHDARIASALERVGKRRGADFSPQAHAIRQSSADLIIVLEHVYANGDLAIVMDARHPADIQQLIEAAVALT